MVFDFCSEALNGSFAVLDMLPAVFFPLALSFYVGLFCFVNGAYFGVRLLDIKGCQLDWQSLVGHHVYLKHRMLRIIMLLTMLWYCTSATF